MNLRKTNNLVQFSPFYFYIDGVAFFENMEYFTPKKLSSNYISQKLQKVVDAILLNYIISANISEINKSY